MADDKALKTLHTDVIDAIKGYDEAAKDAADPELKSLFADMASLHRRAHEDMDALLRAKGDEPDEGGSYMSVVHKTVISVRSAITGLDRSSLRAFADGEARILKAYDEAIEENPPDVAVTSTLQRHKRELERMVATMAEKAA